VQDLVTTPSPMALGTGVVIAFTAFVGFESSSALGAEAHRPLRSVPRVLTGTAIGIAVLLTLGTVVQVMAFDRLGLPRSANPVDDILVALNLQGFLPALDLAVMASFVACATASLIALVRLMMTLAIDGVLPASLGEPHPKWRTPHRAALLLLPIVCGVPVLLLVAGVPVRDLMDQLIQISVLGYLVAYLVVCISVMRFLPRIGESTIGSMVVAGAASLGLSVALVIYLGVSVSHGIVSPALVVSISTVAATSWWWWARRRHPESLQLLGAYDHPSTSSVWWGPAPARTGSLAEDGSPS
jgi:amino acid transporter